uniref:L-type lectin-domain containing receptor kinase IX.2-like n=1 Tax=Erigeron canadensis TaxID=72917 RepID=UPI001CB89D73|nr:L-type lectin-domain containing receptor kinase IX.2-like [Erigeron canadensis]
MTTILAGTLGYMAPEYVMTGKACKESDVFSFGVVAFEIACGRKPIGYRADEERQTTLRAGGYTTDCFSTKFSFVIEASITEYYYADGLTFFLAENNSVATIGGALGLPIDNSSYTKLKPFVAVEFDTYWNSWWDPAELSPNDRHVGINVNSLNSSVFKKWTINITEGAHCQASVTYDSLSKNLGVSVTDIVYGVIDLNYIIDLRDVLPEWVIFGFSAASGIQFEKVAVSSWSFSSSNLQVDEKKTQPPATRLKNNTQNSLLPPTTNHMPVDENKMAGHKVGLIAGLVVVLSFSAIVILYYLWRRNKYRRHEVGYDAEMNKDFEQGTGPKRFSYKEILKATAGFGETNKLGEGGFGGVYKGFLKDLNTYVAVKRVSKISEQGIKEYTTEVKIISRLRHKNLVEVKGWCHEKSELLLVYEFMENGSLDLHLFKQKSMLTWDKRKRIAHGLASALSYLREECKECILHRDIKSSNVMLDSNFDAKLGDFGLAKLVDHEKRSQTTIVAGTLGYMAPEYVITGKASKESDVYSFGVVALEIACGRKPVRFTADEERQTSLLEWVWHLYGTRTLLEAIDPSVGSNYTKEIERLVIVGLWCAHSCTDRRPSMRQVNSEVSLPILPSKMPKTTFNAPPIPSLLGDSSTTSPSVLLFN